MTSGASHDNCCNGNNGNDYSYSDAKHLLVLVDNNADHRKQFVATLISLYNIVEFDSAIPAAMFIDEKRPGIVVISEDIAPWGGYKLAQDIRKHKRTQATPIVFILNAESTASVESAYKYGATGWAAKPYKRADLIQAISNQFNASIEARWNVLPQMQARTLKDTVEFFNSLSDTIDKGEPIAYASASAACTPLVEAVNSDNFKGILGGVRDHDNYTYAHSLRVAVFLSLFGRTIGLPVSDQKLLATGGLLHDVGKMFIPHLVLNKPGKLTDDEFAVMKGHVDATEKLLTASGNIPKGVITIASQHHEKLDGSGYPRGLKGSELNELARMASIVDVFSALTDRRVYKPAMPAEKALGIMREEMANHLDMALLTRFRQMLLDAAVDTTL